MKYTPVGGDVGQRGNDIRVSWQFEVFIYLLIHILKH